MKRNFFRPLFASAFAIALAGSAVAQDAHHPPADSAGPRRADPGMRGPGDMMSMMGMMRQMMSGMMQDRGAMHRTGMMGMGMMGHMQGRMAGGMIQHVEGNIAFIKAELKITDAQSKVWDDYAAALRANAKQLNEIRAELAKAPAGEASPVDRIALQEKHLAAQLEIARRTKPALAALYAALSDDQKKSFRELASSRMRMGMR